MWELAEGDFDGELAPALFLDGVGLALDELAVFYQLDEEARDYVFSLAELLAARRSYGDAAEA